MGLMWMLYCSIAPIQYWLHCKRNSGTAAVPYNQPNVNVFIFFWCCFRFIFILVLLCCHTSNKLFGMIWLNFGCWFHPERKYRERKNKCANGHMFKHFVLNFFSFQVTVKFFFSLDEFLCLFFCDFKALNTVYHLLALALCAPYRHNVFVFVLPSVLQSMSTYRITECNVRSKRWSNVTFVRYFGIILDIR